MIHSPKFFGAVDFLMAVDAHGALAMKPQDTEQPIDLSLQTFVNTLEFEDMPAQGHYFVSRLVDVAELSRLHPGVQLLRQGMEPSGRRTGRPSSRSQRRTV